VFGGPGRLLIHAVHSTASRSHLQPHTLPQRARSPTLTAAKFQLQNSHDCKLRRARSTIDYCSTQLNHLKTQAGPRPRASSASQLSPSHSTLCPPPCPRPPPPKVIAQKDCDAQKSRSSDTLHPLHACSPQVITQVRRGPHFLIRLHDSRPRAAKPHWRTAFLSARAPAYPRPPQHRQP